MTRNTIIKLSKYLLLFLPFLTLKLYSQNIDINILKKINLNRNKQLDNTFISLTNSAAPISIGTPLLIYGVSILTKDSSLKKKSFYLGATIISTSIISTILKYGINRTRPFISYPYLEKRTSGGSPSFPSGHTSDAFAFATSLSIAFPKWYVVLPAYTWAGAVGYSRMDLGVHYPSDVLAGAIIGTSTAYLCYKCKKYLAQKPKKK